VPLHFRVVEVRTCGEPPGDINHLCDMAEVALREAMPIATCLALLAQTCVEHLRLECSDCHPLAVDRVEAAQGVAAYDEAARGAGKFFVPAAQIGRQLVDGKARQRFGATDGVVDIKRRQTARELNIAPLVRRRMISKPSSLRNQPAVAFDRDKQTEPFFMWRGG